MLKHSHIRPRLQSAHHHQANCDRANRPPQNLASKTHSQARSYLCKQLCMAYSHTSLVFKVYVTNGYMLLIDEMVHHRPRTVHQQTQSRDCKALRVAHSHIQLAHPFTVKKQNFEGGGGMWSCQAMQDSCCLLSVCGRHALSIQQALQKQRWERHQIRNFFATSE